jgi:hypothetical protein
MPYQIKYDPEKQLITGTLCGEINNLVLKEYVLEMEKMLDLSSIQHILSDYREAHFSLSTIQLFRLPDKHDELMNTLGLNVHKFKRALLINEHDLELGKFFENVAMNRGQMVKVFTSESKALQWLAT